VLSSLLLLNIGQISLLLSGSPFEA
jgi:hypothetical protein